MYTFICIHTYHSVKAIMGEKKTKFVLRFLSDLTNNAEIVMVLKGLIGGLGQIM